MCLEFVLMKKSYRIEIFNYVRFQHK